jgi:hypothetical protein
MVHQVQYVQRDILLVEVVELNIQEVLQVQVEQVVVELEVQDLVKEQLAQLILVVELEELDQMEVEDQMEPLEVLV